MDILVLTTYDESPFLLQQLESLADRGVSPTLRTVPGHVEAGESRSVRDYLEFFPAVMREARKDYDLIHAHYGLTVPMALPQRRLPVVCSLWGTDLEGPGRPISRACAPFCDEVIVMTPGMKRRLGTDCTVLPFGIDLERFQPAPQSQAQARVDWDSDEHHVLFPYPPERTVKDYPRARRLVRTVDNLLERPVNLQVVHGVDHDRVSTYMNAADALFLTSWREGSPTSVKEAMACNLPVVATDVGDVRTRLEAVDPSSVAKSDDELVRGLVEVLERGERSNGREAVRAVSQDAVVDRLLEIYRRAIGNPIDTERVSATSR
ncbi:glycosyltransferase [Salinadaptatus halalkaliphilus]|uniref:Glycosyltransferase n=1 Tax=Salinadaptatus halalkaliphilus TaxID=2419781 RepID=A0A4S3TQ77_9EURY|nr:glycosyltransferase [Salinadaptatus halalkaliphilus]THE66406.1 glycosyltransferase [Salinadaptatus halalkaliphilus]